MEDNRNNNSIAGSGPDFYFLVSAGVFAAQTLAVTACAVMAWAMEPLREVECASLMLLFSLVVYTMVLPKPRLLRLVVGAGAGPDSECGRGEDGLGPASLSASTEVLLLRHMTMPGRPFSGSSP